MARHLDDAGNGHAVEVRLAVLDPSIQFERALAWARVGRLAVAISGHVLAEMPRYAAHRQAVHRPCHRRGPPHSGPPVPARATKDKARKAFKALSPSERADVWANSWRLSSRWRTCNALHERKVPGLNC